jgi:hypothetical protein
MEMVDMGFSSNSHVGDEEASTLLSDRNGKVQSLNKVEASEKVTTA